MAKGTEKIGEFVFENLQTELMRARSETDTNPTDGQKEAGNYKKGRVNIHGFSITIENPKGSYRSGKDKNGKPWKTLMHNDYGYFTRTLGKDGDAVDVFIGPNLNSDKIFPIDQYVGGKFDETKVMLGFNSAEEAKRAYLSNYEKDWKGFKYITEVSVDEFKDWLYNGRRQRKAFAKYVDMKKNVVRMNEEKLMEIVSECVKNAISKQVNEDALAGVKAVAGRIGNGVKRSLGFPSYGKNHYPGTIKDTFKDASYEKDYWKLGKDMEENPEKYNGKNLAKIAEKIKKFSDYGVISKDSAMKVLKYLGERNIKAAGHELCYGTYTFGVDKDYPDIISRTDYERRLGIKQLEEAVSKSVRRAINEIAVSSSNGGYYMDNFVAPQQKNPFGVFYKGVSIPDNLDAEIYKPKIDACLRKGWSVDDIQSCIDHSSETAREAERC
ncbi:MAG: hypothetical protein J6X18_01360 [Bacteroidales bacterium]|nr:hypothetical protein [Bacteroidales bacterium]